MRTSAGSASALDEVSEGFYYDGANQTVWVKFSLDSSQATSVALL